MVTTTRQTENVDVDLNQILAFYRLFFFRSTHLLHPLTLSYISTVQKSYIFLFCAWRPQGNISKQKLLNNHSFIFGFKKSNGSEKEQPVKVSQHQVAQWPAIFSTG